MKLNKPKYSLYSNGMYAIEGFIDITKNESSFKLQLILFFVMSIVAWELPIGFGYASILFLSLFIPILAEIINSSIERVVDLVTSDYHILAKQAKDAGATFVLISLILTGLIWIFTLLIAFGVVS